MIGHGFQYGDPAVRVGKKFPKTKFVAIEGNASSENAASYRIACEEAGYLMGILAASVSKSGVIGMVGGVEQPSIVKVVEAYKRGAKSYRSDIKVLESYISTFTDVAKGKEAAVALFDQGADVVYHAAGGSGACLFDAAKETSEASGTKVWAIGVDSDQYNLVDPAVQEFVLTSMLKRVDVAVFTVCTALHAGEPLPPINMLDLAIGGVGYATSGGFIDDYVAELDAMAAAISSGELVVPETPEG